MKKRFLIILAIFMFITLIATYFVYNYRMKLAETQKINSQYEEYYGINILGTELISIINKTMDTNGKYQIEKDASGKYVENGTNSIKIYIEFNYKEKIKTVSMEDIYNNGIEAFVKTYSTASFKCTNITYHEETKNIKSLTFSEMEENLQK